MGEMHQFVTFLPSIVDVMIRTSNNFTASKGTWIDREILWIACCRWRSSEVEAHVVVSIPKQRMKVLKIPNHPKIGHEIQGQYLLFN